MDDPELIMDDPELETKDEKIDRNYDIPLIICDMHDIASNSNGDSYLYEVKQIGIDYYDPIREKLEKDGAKSTYEILVWLAKHLIRVDVRVNLSSKRVNRKVYRGAFITDVQQDYITATGNTPIYIDFVSYCKTEGEIQTISYSS